MKPSIIHEHAIDADLTDIDDAMDMDVPIDSLDTDISATAKSKGKRKASMIELSDDNRTSRPRTLGGGLQKGSVVVREITDSKMGNMSTSYVWSEPISGILPHPLLLTYLSATIEGTDEILEARNAENDGKFPCMALPC